MKTIDQRFIKDLKRRLVVHAGFVIDSKSDCRVLQSLIQQQVGSSLSESTLYRLFLNKQDQHTFYRATLDILSQFIGFNSWSVFCEMTASNQEAGGRPTQSTFDLDQPGLLDFVISNNAWHIAKEFFDAIHQYQKHESIDVIGWSIFLALQRNPKKEKKFYQLFASHPVVRAAFFEIGADPDFSLPHYAYGIQQYIKHIPSHGSPHYYQDHLFARCLLIRHYFIHEQFDSFYSQYQIVQDISEETLLKHVKSVYPLARYFQAKVLFHHLEQNHSAIKQCYTRFFHWILPLFPSLNLSEKKAAVHCLVEAALLTHSAQAFTPMLYKHFSAFISMLFTSQSKPALEAILERTEFNGIRLQQRLRQAC